MHDQRIAGAAKISGHLLGPCKWRVAGHGPSSGKVVEGIRPAQVVVTLQHILDSLLHAIEVGHLVEHSDHAAFGARAVVTHNVEEERVLHLTHVFNRLHQPANFMVRVGAECGEHFHLPGEQFLFVRRQLVPVLDVDRFRRQARPRRNDAEFDLPCQRVLADLVPPPVELTLVLGDPFFRHMVRRVRRPCGEVDKERLVRSQAC